MKQALQCIAFMSQYPVVLAKTRQGEQDYFWHFVLLFVLAILGAVTCLFITYWSIIRVCGGRRAARCWNRMVVKLVVSQTIQGAEQRAHHAEQRPLPRELPEQRPLPREPPEMVYTVVHGERYHLRRDCMTLNRSRAVEERRVCTECLRRNP